MEKVQRKNYAEEKITKWRKREEKKIARKKIESESAFYFHVTDLFF